MTEQLEYRQGDDAERDLLEGDDLPQLRLLVLGYCLIGHVASGFVAGFEMLYGRLLIRVPPEKP